MTSEELPLLNVLMVDDSHNAYVMICDFLSVSRTNRFKPTWASSSDVGIEQILSNVYDVCLIDYDLDKRTGVEVITEVVSRGNTTPLILLTGYGSHKVDLGAMKAGAVDYLDKAQLRPEMLERSIRYAVEQSRILRAEREQRIFAEALLDISSTLNSTLEFDHVLNTILTNVSKVIPHDTANIMLVEEGVARIVSEIGYESPSIIQELHNARFAIREDRIFKEMMHSRQPVLVEDSALDSGWIQAVQPQRLRGYLASPILLGDQVIGFINLESYTPNFFTDAHAQRLQIFAGMAAVAIQNAFAYERAQSAAAEEERQRLARDLHDAVSQTLFSASVISETLPRLMNHDPDEVLRGLLKLSKLTKGALAEMRTLLVELRPKALIETELSILLKQYVNGFQSRSDAEIHLEITGKEWRLPQDVHVSLYRITQEALNNVMKHARAAHVYLDLSYDSDQVRLYIQDDGRGFDPGQVSSESMGLRIMRERAESVNMMLNLESIFGQGTQVEAFWQKGNQYE